MSSRGKKKTTMAKLNREARLRERKVAKQERKEARRDAAMNPELEVVPVIGDELGREADDTDVVDDDA